MPIGTSINPSRIGPCFDSFLHSLNLLFDFLTLSDWHNSQDSLRFVIDVPQPLSQDSWSFFGVFQTSSSWPDIQEPSTIFRFAPSARNFFLDLQRNFSQVISAFPETFPRVPGAPFARLTQSALWGRNLLAKSYHSWSAGGSPSPITAIVPGDEQKNVWKSAGLQAQSSNQLLKNMEMISMLEWDGFHVAITIFLIKTIEWTDQNM
jgi:hypothetical protein